MKQIHEDARGKIHQLQIGDKEFIIMETKKDHSRGGDFHKSIQHDVVLSGRVEFRHIDKDEDITTILKEGQMITFKPNQPHMLTALTDSLVLEWLEGIFEKQYYEPFRRLIK